MQGNAVCCTLRGSVQASKKGSMFQSFETLCMPVIRQNICLHCQPLSLSAVQWPRRSISMRAKRTSSGVPKLVEQFFASLSRGEALQS